MSSSAGQHDELSNPTSDGFIRHFQVYRGMSPTSSNRLEVGLSEIYGRLNFADLLADNISINQSVSQSVNIRLLMA